MFHACEREEGSPWLGSTTALTNSSSTTESGSSFVSLSSNHFHRIRVISTSKYAVISSSCISYNSPRKQGSFCAYRSIISRSLFPVSHGSSSPPLLLKHMAIYSPAETYAKVSFLRPVSNNLHPCGVQGLEVL
jgi:hypothetical protein